MFKVNYISRMSHIFILSYATEGLSYDAERDLLAIAKFFVQYVRVTNLPS